MDDIDNVLIKFADDLAQVKIQQAAVSVHLGDARNEVLSLLDTISSQVHYGCDIIRDRIVDKPELLLDKILTKPAIEHGPAVLVLVEARKEFIMLQTEIQHYEASLKQLNNEEQTLEDQRLAFLKTQFK